MNLAVSMKNGLENQDQREGNQLQEVLNYTKREIRIARTKAKPITGFVATTRNRGTQNI